MKSGILKISFKVLGTIILVGGFLLLVARTPFLSDDRAPLPADSGQYATEQQNLPNFRLDPGGLSPEDFPVPGGPGFEGGSGLGLYKAYFSETADSPGFATEEFRVEGDCEGAGRRYVEEACPDCLIIAGEPGEPGEPAMLMWTQLHEGEPAFYTVTADCMAIGDDGVPIVGTVRFGGGAVDLVGRTEELALARVPLLPGATRLAAVEIGEWLTTFDDVVRPSSALADMAVALGEMGWRTAGDSVREDLQRFEGDQVFTNSANAVCVISLQQIGNTHRLTTLISTNARG